MRRIKYLYYKLQRRFYWNLKYWLKQQIEIYRLPREARPMYWKLQQELSTARALLMYDFSKKNIWQFLGKLSELDGLGAIVDDGTQITTYDSLTRTTYPEILAEISKVIDEKDQASQKHSAAIVSRIESNPKRW